MNYVVKFKTI